MIKNINNFYVNQMNSVSFGSSTSNNDKKTKNKTISSNAMTTPSVPSQQVVSNIVAGQKAIDKTKKQQGVDKTTQVQQSQKTNEVTPYKNTLKTDFHNNDVKLMGIVVRTFNAKDKDGNERELHLKQAIDCLSFDKDIDKNDVHPVVKVHENMKETIFISNDSFTVSQLLVIGKCQYKCDNYQLATVVKGSGKVDEYDVKVGDNFLIPTNTSIELDGQMMIMMTTK